MITVTDIFAGRRRGPVMRSQDRLQHALRVRRPAVVVESHRRGRAQPHDARIAVSATEREPGPDLILLQHGLDPEPKDVQLLIGQIVYRTAA